MIGFNPYSLLELDQDASPSEIRSAFKRLMLRYHPDKQASTPDSQELGRSIIEAYHFLSNPGNRAKYDAVLKSEQGKLTNMADRAMPAQEVFGPRQKISNHILQCEQCYGQTEVDFLEERQQQMFYVSCEHCGLILSLKTDTVQSATFDN